MSRRATDRRLVRRSPWVVCTWDEDGCHLTDVAIGRDVCADADDLRLVAALDSWADRDDLAAIAGAHAPGLARRVSRLVRAGILERGDLVPSVARASAEGWREWGQPALWFHRATRDVEWAPPGQLESLVARRAVEHPSAPRPRLPNTPGLALPVGSIDAAGVDAFRETLRSRRTWRRFSRGVLPLESFSELLLSSFGVQAWMRDRIGGPYALKTSPSGGACHPLDAFVVVNRVSGVEAGVYHYDADDHRLIPVRRRWRPDLRRWFPSQEAYPRAAVVCVLVARFERLQWKYSTPRAYRVILLDAGHVGQTFCLVATHLGLAPCCTGAFDDRAMEHDLGVDGVERAAVYAMAVGCRPAGVEWAPFPDPADVPRLTPPSWRGRQPARRPAKSGRPIRGRARAR